MQTMDIYWSGFLGFGANVDRVGGGIDYRSGSDTDLGNEIAGLAGVTVGDGGGADSSAVSGIQHGGLPKLLAGVGVGVEGIDEIALGGDKDDVVLFVVGHEEVGDVKGLGIGVAGDGATFIDGTTKEAAKRCRTDSRWSESIFLEVLAGALWVVMMRENTSQIGDRDACRGRIVGVGNACGRNGVKAGLRAGCEQAGWGDSAGRAVAPCVAINRPGYAEVLRVVVHGG